MNNKIKILSGFTELKEMNFIKDFSMESRSVLISLTDISKPKFIKPSMDEIQVIDYLKISNSTTIEILMCIMDELETTNTFPSQKKIAGKIHKDNTTVCKSISKLKAINIVYKSEDGNFILSKLNNRMTETIKQNAKGK